MPRLRRPRLGAKAGAPISSEEYDLEASGKGWQGASRQDHQDFSASLWALLSNKIEGDALNCIRNVEKGNGVEAWRKLHAEYRPSSATQAMAYMVKILTQSPAKDADHATASLNQFEEHIRAYEECGERYKLDEVVKLARLRQLMPINIQEFLALKVPGECDYPTMRRAISEYLLNFTKGAAPMLDNLQAEKPPTKPKAGDWWPEEWPEPSGDLVYYGHEWNLSWVPRIPRQLGEETSMR